MEDKQRKALIILCSVLGIILMLMIGWTIFDRTVDRSGWSLNDGLYSYRDFHGRKVSGWYQIDGCTYYFDENSIMHTGWLEQDGNRYYFGEDGVMTTGWRRIGDARHFFDDDGSMHTGWLQINDRQYYLDETGAMVCGWLHLLGNTHYFDDTGTLVKGWQEIDGQLRYFTPKGIHVVLVNADNPVPDWYEVELKNFLPWHDVADVAFEPLTKMLEDCKAAGYEYEFNSAYRSIKTQEDILWARTQEHIDIGFDPDDAYAEARRTEALPGTSEHHLGLAVDVLNVDNAQKKALEWLGAHCWEYGFILRYAEEKAPITGIISEPWHFRYVGTEVSMAMKDTGLCLEEYLGAPAVKDSTIE